jgi:hypothetical protein
MFAFIDLKPLSQLPHKILFESSALASVLMLPLSEALEKSVILLVARERVK